MENFEDYTITVNWEVDDGYIGRDRPQSTKVKPYQDMDFEDWNELSERDKQSYLCDEVQNDYENKISFAINDYGI